MPSHQQHQTVAVLSDQLDTVSEREWLERLTGMAVPRAVDWILCSVFVL